MEYNFMFHHTLLLPQESGWLSIQQNMFSSVTSVAREHDGISKLASKLPANRFMSNIWQIND